MFFWALLFFVLLPYTTNTIDKITILTYPVEHSSNVHWCHKGVTYSLLRGLQELKIDYNYNPVNLSDIGQVVVVLANCDALQQAIEWKRKGKIKKLLAGPNLVNLPHDNNGIITSKEIDIYLVNCEWIKVAYIQDEPLMEDKLHIWYAGIDPLFWEPKNSKSTNNNVLVYWKTEGENFCGSVEQILKKNNWNPIRIRYGQYDLNHFKNCLEECKFAIFLSRSETQGIALAEVWAMDVPTLVWDPQELTYLGRKYSPVSACPYLNSQVGIGWKKLSELECIVKNIDYSLTTFSPRNWVLNNMTDRISALKLLDIIAKC